MPGHVRSSQSCCCSCCRCIAVHPTMPYILTCSDDMLIKLWDWDKVGAAPAWLAGWPYFCKDSGAGMRGAALVAHTGSCGRKRGRTAAQGQPSWKRVAPCLWGAAGCAAAALRFAGGMPHPQAGSILQQLLLLHSCCTAA